MGFPIVHQSSHKELINELVDTGEKLLLFRSYSVDELHKLLQNTENVLAKVGQCPPKSTAESLLPLMKALINEEILWHAELNIQIVMACCMNELTRITAPQAPYPDRRMKVVFRLFIVALKQLSCESPSDFAIPLRILRTIAEVKTCLYMMDVDNELIIEMFQLFLSGIRSDHPADIFKYMKTIMTMVIEESDKNEISFQLLEPLLTSVKMDNKKISPISWELGENVIKHCATKLQPHLRKMVKSKNLDLDDYPEIVISLCQNTSNDENMHLSSENPAETVQIGGSKEKERMKTQHNELKWSSTLRKKILETKKVDSCSTSKPTKIKIRKKLDQEEEKEIPKRPKEEVVNSRIQVWWPMDETFYKGTVTAFNPTTNKHTITYDDGETEKLNLKKETWELLNDKNPQETRNSRKEEKADQPSIAKEPIQRREKTMKRKEPSSNEQHTSSSSKRAKREGHNLVKPRVNFASDVSNAINELEEETRETNVSAHNEEENQTQVKILP